MSGKSLGRRLAPVALLLVVLLGLAWLVRARFLRSEVLATVATIEGRAERDVAAHVGAWSPAAVGATLTVGDGVRTLAVSHAALLLSDGSNLAMDPETVVRFLARDPSSKEQRFDLEMGEAVLEAGAKELFLGTEVGMAVLAPGTRLTLRHADQKTRYEVSVGMARFEGAGGASVEVSAGHGIEIGIGIAQLEPFALEPAAAAPPPSAAPPASAEAPPATPPSGGALIARVVGAGGSARAPGATGFSRLKAGETELEAGTTLRLAAGTTADVARGAQRATLRGAGDFVLGAENQPFIVAQGGSVALVGSEAEVQVAVPGGSILAKMGAKGDVSVRPRDTRVSVTAGSVEVRTAAGVEELGAGESGSIAAKGGATEVEGRGPGYVDFTVSAGASFAVHDPKPPTAIGFATSGVCPEGAVVEVDRGRVKSRGQGTVSVLMTPGAHQYAIRCVTGGGLSEEAAASGSVTVAADAGTARIPRTAPATTVDTDGRSYTVLYQNLLPKLTVRWPKAPAGGPFTLRVSSPGGASRSVAAGTPSYSFASGALREGVHRFSFEGGGAKARDTTVTIKFDNAAPTATLTSPQNGSFSAGSSVTVSGLALEGWKVSAGGVSLPLDDQLRFSGDVPAPAGQRALAVEFVSPRRGVHYYLRRAAGP